MSETHPFAVQQQVDFEDHAVVDRDLLVSVQDLKYPAEHGAVVDPRSAEAAFVWCGRHNNSCDDWSVLRFWLIGLKQGDPSQCTQREHYLKKTKQKKKTNLQGPLECERY